MRLARIAMAPRVSIILPVFNAVRTLEATLRSVLAQTFPAWELVLVDDGSTDGSADLAAALLGADPRWRLVRTPHAGLVPALEAGLAAAHASLLARMDADDEMHPGRLEAQVEFLDREGEVGLVGCGVEFGGQRDRQAGYALHVAWLNTLLTPTDIALNRFIESPLAHPSVMFRRSVLDRHGGYRPGPFPEDYELWLRWLDAGVLMAKIPQVLLTWRDSPTRLSRTDARYGADAFYRLKAFWLARELQRQLRGRALWIWGAGRPTRVRAAHLEGHGLRIAGYIDIDPRKQGRVLQGRPVIAPAQLASPAELVVVGYVAKRGARELIRAALGQRGLVEGQDFWMAA